MCGNLVHRAFYIEAGPSILALLSKISVINACTGEMYILYIPTYTYRWVSTRTAGV